MRNPPLVLTTWLVVGISSSTVGAFTLHVPGLTTMVQARQMLTKSIGFRPLLSLSTDNNNDTPLVIKQQEDDDEVFVNDGVFSFMEPYLDVIGFKQGRQIVGAIPQESNVFMDEDEAQQRRLQAEIEMVNISMEERQRRKDIGKIAAYISAFYIIWVTLIGDHGDFVGHLLRFSSCIPLFLAWGFYISGKQGL